MLGFQRTELGGGDIGAIANQLGFKSTAEFYKALTSGYETDQAQLSGGSALRKESLEASLLSTIARNKHFVTWNLLPKTSATALVDQWTRETKIGGVPGSGATGIGRVIPQTQGEYEREIGRVKFMKDRRAVDVEAEMESSMGLASAVSRETDKGSLKVLLDANWMIHYGRSDCSTYEIDGFKAQLEAIGGAQVVDLRGATISPNAVEFIEAADVIWGRDHFGMATDYVCSADVQTDIDQLLDPAFRVAASDRDLKLGAPVTGIRTSFGDNPIKRNIDPFLVESEVPFIARGSEYAALVTGSGILAPASVAGVPGAHASSQFTAAHAGNYYYGVEAFGANMKASALVKSLVVAIAAGDRSVVTITPQAGNNADYYVLYRGRRNGTNADDDMKEIARIPANGDNPVTYNDANQNIPGTSHIEIYTVFDDAVTIRRFGEQFRFPLAATDTAQYLWAQIMGFFLRLGKPNQHVLIKNVLPNKARKRWNPF